MSCVRLYCCCFAFTIALDIHSATAFGIDGESGEVTVEQLADMSVIGKLGKPLGAIVTIEGTFKDMTFTRAKADEGRVELIIDMVDGEAIADPMSFEFRKASRGPSAKELDGLRFKIIGYEVAEFRGDVKGAGEFDDRPVVARASRQFGLYSDFIVLREIKDQQRKDKNGIRESSVQSKASSSHDSSGAK